MKRLFVCFLLLSFNSKAQTVAQQMANTVMSWWSDSILNQPPRWSYDMGVVLKGMEALWYATGDAGHFKYIQKGMDVYVQEDGTIRGYQPDAYNIDHINNGKLLLLLYRVTEIPKYKKAADLLRIQLLHHPRTSEGGFWHKQIYPWQMWLDGLYMGQPFYAEYAELFQEDTTFQDIARQFILMERHARDPKTGYEYTDGRKLPAEYENGKAAYELAKWLLLQANKK